MFTNHPNNHSKFFSAIFIVNAILSVVGIVFYTGYNLLFLSFLTLNIVFSITFFKRFNLTTIQIARVLLAALFIYSGFVKGVDPLGTQYRIEDYLYVYKVDFLVPFALSFSVLLNTLEFLLGAFILFKLYLKPISVFTFILMVFFTFTTLIDALYSPVPDCGCFGDALIISNWQTFYKNLVLMSFVLVILARRNDFKNYLPIKPKIVYAAMIPVLFASFQLFNIRNLPAIDFSDWKVGNRLLPKDPLPVKYYLTYKNSKTGELREFLSKDLPWQDSIFMAQWKWESSREEDPNKSSNFLFPMVDIDGNELSKTIAGDSVATVILVFYKIEKIESEAIDNIKTLTSSKFNIPLNWVYATNIDFIEFDRFLSIHKLPKFQIVNSDDTSLKAAIRSNPGVIVLRTGKVIAKYHYSNIPNNQQLEKELTLD